MPHGWSHWGGFLQTYDFYNASAWAVEASAPPVDPHDTIQVMTGVHQGDFLGNFTIASARRAMDAGKPFFIHVTPVMPHWGTCYGPTFPPGEGYAPTDPHWEFDLTDPATGQHWAMPISPCPSDRHKHAFDGQTNRHVPGVWNVTATGVLPSFVRHGVDLQGRLEPYQVRLSTV